eukprot:g3403.t1
MLTCTTLTIDLTALGAPGLLVDLTIEGRVGASKLFDCWSWDVRIAAVFRWGIHLFGKSLKALQVAVSIEGTLNIEELPCAAVDDHFGSSSMYCQWLPNVIPPEDLTMRSVRSTCHSDSPLDVVMTYLLGRIDAIKQTMHLSKRGTESHFPLKDHFLDIEKDLEEMTELTDEEFSESAQIFSDTMIDAAYPKMVRYARQIKKTWGVSSSSRADHACGKMDKPVLEPIVWDDEVTILGWVRRAERVAGMFIRVLDDIVSIFNVYVAGTPMWNGNSCELLPVALSGTESHKKSVVGALLRGVGETIEHVRHSAHEKMNPWCLHPFAFGDLSWISSGSGEDHIIEGKYYPQMMCLVVEKKEGGDDATSHHHHHHPRRTSHTFAFRNACKQRCATVDPTKNTMVTTACPTTCQRAHVSTLFEHTFPELFDAMQTYFKKIGQSLEDALIAGGLAMKHGRQFPPARGSTPCDRCDGSFDHHSLVHEGTDVDILSHAKDAAESLREHLNAFLDTIGGDEDEKGIEDNEAGKQKRMDVFNVPETFRAIVKANDEAYVDATSSSCGMKHGKSTAAAAGGVTVAPTCSIEAWKLRLQHRAIEEATNPTFTSTDASRIFPLPAQFREATKFVIGLGAKSDYCKLTDGSTAKAGVSVVLKRSRKSWIQYSEAEIGETVDGDKGVVCEQLFLSPLNSLSVHVERCGGGSGSSTKTTESAEDDDEGEDVVQDEDVAEDDDEEEEDDDEVDDKEEALASWTVKISFATPMPPSSSHGTKSKPVSGALNHWGAGVREAIKGATTVSEGQHVFFRGANVATSRRLLMFPLWPFQGSLSPGTYDDGSGYWPSEPTHYDVERTLSATSSSGSDMLRSVKGRRTEEEEEEEEEAATKQAEEGAPITPPSVPIHSSAFRLARVFLSVGAEKLSMKTVRDVVNAFVGRVETKKGRSIPEALKQVSRAVSHLFRHTIQETAISSLGFGAQSGRSKIVTVTLHMGGNADGDSFSPFLAGGKEHIWFEAFVDCAQSIEATVPLPGIAKIHAQLSLAQRYDMTRLFNMLYHKFWSRRLHGYGTGKGAVESGDGEGKGESGTRFDRCISCLSGETQVRSADHPGDSTTWIYCYGGKVASPSGTCVESLGTCAGTTNAVKRFEDCATVVEGK